MIDADIAVGAVPTGIATFEELHDQLNANEYLQGGWRFVRHGPAETSRRTMGRRANRCRHLLVASWKDTAAANWGARPQRDGRFTAIWVDGRWPRWSAAARGLGVSCLGRAADTVTVRDSKRFAEPLALPGSCPLYVRDQWISRTHDRILSMACAVGLNV